MLTNKALGTIQTIHDKLVGNNKSSRKRLLSRASKNKKYEKGRKLLGKTAKLWEIKKN